MGWVGGEGVDGGPANSYSPAIFLLFFRGCLVYWCVGNEEGAGFDVA